MIKTVLFDMFNTLAEPHNSLKHLEYEHLGISEAEWDACVWEPELQHERALGIIRSENELVERICEKLPFKVTPEQKETIRFTRNNRMKQALCDISPNIISTLKVLQKRGLKMCVVSNADVVDILHWQESPLKQYMEDALFSCDIGLIKPERDIYELALERLQISAAEAVFVGDGGDRELMGAKAVGLTTVWTEHYIIRGESAREMIKPFADYRTESFCELPDIIERINNNLKGV